MEVQPELDVANPTDGECQPRSDDLTSQESETVKSADTDPVKDASVPSETVPPAPVEADNDVQHPTTRPRRNRHHRGFYKKLNDGL